MKTPFDRIDGSPILGQVIPLLLTVVVLGVLLAILHLALTIFNMLPVKIPIVMQIHAVDVIVGITIYLKTSIDFAIFMGRLMTTYQGWRSRVAIEIGTAFGNAFGTIAIIGMWVMFKDIHLLLALMVLIASLVLFELAHGSLEHFGNWESEGGIKKLLYLTLSRSLTAVTRLTDPVLSRVMPNLGEKLKGKTGLSWKKLLGFSGSVPFILGLDDFAGYVPLFSVVNVYGFAIGVITAHTILNISLFLSPKRTIEAVKNEYVSFAGTIAFIALALYGIWESGKIVLTLIR